MDWPGDVPGEPRLQGSEARRGVGEGLLVAELLGLGGISEQGDGKRALRDVNPEHS
jgi:hypothetical protein